MFSSQCKIVQVILLWLVLFFSTGVFASDDVLYSTDKLIFDLTKKDLSDTNKIRRLEYARVKLPRELKKEQSFALMELACDKSLSVDVRAKIAEFLTHATCPMTEEKEIVFLLDKMKANSSDQYACAAIMAMMEFGFECRPEFLAEIEDKMIDILKDFKDRPEKLYSVFLTFSSFDKRESNTHYDVYKVELMTKCVVDEKLISLLSVIIEKESASILCERFEIVNDNLVPNYNYNMLSFLAKLLQEGRERNVIIALLNDKFYPSYITQKEFSSILAYYRGNDKGLKTAATSLLTKLFCRNEDALRTFLSNEDLPLHIYLEKLFKDFPKDALKKRYFKEGYYPLNVFATNVYLDYEDGPYHKLLHAIMIDDKISTELKSSVLSHCVGSGLSKDSNACEKFIAWILKDNPCDTIGDNPRLWTNAYLNSFRFSLSTKMKEALLIKVISSLKYKIESRPEDCDVFSLAELNLLPKYTAKATLLSMKAVKENDRMKEWKNLTGRAILKKILGEDFGYDYDAWQKAVDAMPEDKPLVEEEK